MEAAISRDRSLGRGMGTCSGQNSSTTLSSSLLKPSSNLSWEIAISIAHPVVAFVLCKGRFPWLLGYPLCSPV